MMLFFVVFKCTQDNTEVASKSRMSDNQSWLLGETVSISTKIKLFHAFLEFSVMSVTDFQ